MVGVVNGVNRRPPDPYQDWGIPWSDVLLLPSRSSPMENRPKDETPGRDRPELARERVTSSVTSSSDARHIESLVIIHLLHIK